jgi:hypothetical protein
MILLEVYGIGDFNRILWNMELKIYYIFGYGLSNSRSLKTYD